MNCSRNIHLLLALLVTLTLAQLPDCNSGISPTDLIQTGKLSAVAATSSAASRQLNYPIQVTSFSVPPSGFRITASVSEYNYGLNRNTGFDFSLGAFQIAGTTNGQIVLNINNDKSWISVAISYILTARQYMSVGFFAVSGFQLNKINQDNYEYKHALTDFNAQNKKVSSFALLAGIRTSATMISTLNIRSFKIDTKTGVATLKIKINVGSSLEVIFFSYIWWVNSPALKFSAFNPKVGSSVAYQFPAMNRIINNKHSFIGLGFAGSGSTGAINCIGTQCASQCIKVLDCFTQRGIIANQKCYRCGPNEEFQNLQCVKKVDPTCGEGQVLRGTQCTCMQGYFWVSPTRCVKCPTNGFWNGKQCLCNYNFQLVNKICVRCPVNSVFNETSRTCNCKPPSFLSGSQCVTCKGNEVWDAASKTCICAPTYHRINGVCSCPPNSSPSSQGCVCNDGFKADANSKCIAVNVCPAGSFQIPGTNQCVCLDGKHFFEGKCINCGNNAGWDSNQNKCVCLSGFLLFNDACASCPSNSQSNGTHCVCVNGYEIQNGACVKKTVQCGPNQVLEGNACVCKPTFVKFGQICSCPLNSKLVNGKCECNQGLTLVNNVCEAASKCPALSAWDGSKCVCITGYHDINGKCQQCPPNSTYNAAAKQCFCNIGFYRGPTGCDRCDPSCRRCFFAGPNGCSACRNKFKLERIRGQQVGKCVCRNPGDGC